MSLTNRVLVTVPDDLIDWAPGFHVYGLAIDNPSGSWLYVNQQWYIPPYTFAWTKPVNGSLNITVEFVSGPGGIVSVNVGGPVDVYAYDYAKPDATGYTTLGPGAITSDLIAAGAITAGKIAAGVIVAGDIADGAVTTDKLADAAVTGAKILNDAVDSTKLADDAVVAGKIAAGTVASADIADAAIIASKIAAGAVVAGKVAADAIDANAIQANAITSGKIAASAVTAGKIAADAISATEIQAGAVGTSEISSSASIQNVSNSGATVTINASGINILNGALTLQDEFGKTVMGASGFSGSWFDFVRLGIYNARFLVGTVGTIPNGRTSALPYWTLSNVTGTPTATYLSGGGVKVTFNAVNAKKRLFSDQVPVLAGAIYAVEYAFSATVAAGELQIIPAIKWFDSSGSFISTSTLITAGTTSSIPTTLANDSGTASAPATAAYAEVQIDIVETTSHSASNQVTLVYAGLVQTPPNSLEYATGSAPTRYFGTIETLEDLRVDGTFLQTRASAIAYQTSVVTLSTSEQDVPGCTLSLDAGTWLVIGNFDFHVSPAGSSEAHGLLRVGLTTQANYAFLQSVDSRNRATVSQTWIITVAGTTTVKLRCIATSTVATIKAEDQSSIVAIPLFQ